MVFQHFGLLWITNKNKYIKFEMNVQDSHWTDKCPCYNTTICTKVKGKIFKDYFKTGHKYRYELIYAAYAYNKEHVQIIDNVSGGRGGPIVII